MHDPKMRRESLVQRSVGRTQNTVNWLEIYRWRWHFRNNSHLEKRQRPSDDPRISQEIWIPALLYVKDQNKPLSCIVCVYVRLCLWGEMFLSIPSTQHYFCLHISQSFFHWLMSSVFFGDVIDVCCVFPNAVFLQHPASQSLFLLHILKCVNQCLCSGGPSRSEGTEEDTFSRANCLFNYRLYNLDEDTKQLLLHCFLWI